MPRTDTPVLILNGQLKGEIRQLENPGLGLVNVEAADPDHVPTRINPVGEYHQVHYRTTRYQCVDRTVWVGWCGVEARPPVAGLIELLFSDIAKQLIKLTENET